jgi:hypothetical protein
MKVAVYETMEVTDEERVAIAALLDGDGGKKRKASAAEMKQWLWQQGADWRSALATGDAEEADDLLGLDEPEYSPGLEDLI